MFRVNLMLADAAQVADGKLNMLGGGWTIIVPGAPFAVCGGSGADAPLPLLYFVQMAA